MNIIQEIKKEILDCLNSLDYLLFNEKDLQIYLAIKLKDKGYKVYTEYHLPKGFNKHFDEGYEKWKTEKPSIDIVLEYENKYITIELKYKLKEIKGKLERFGQKSENEFSLVTNQAAQNEARYDFWKDVKRLELIKECYEVGGIALFMTNDESYKQTKSNCKYSKFGLDEEKNAGLLHWGKDPNVDLGKKKKKTKSGTEYYERPNFELSQRYEGEWQDLNEKFHIYTVVV